MADEIITAPDTVKELQHLGAIVGSGLDYRLEHDPRFLDRIGQARASFQAGHGVKLEDLPAALAKKSKRTSHR